MSLALDIALKEVQIARLDVLEMLIEERVVNEKDRSWMHAQLSAVANALRDECAELKARQA